MPKFDNPYDAVIADLEAKRAQIDAAIVYIKGVREMVATLPTAPVPTVTAPMSASGGMDLDSIPSDAFFNLTIVEATVKFLNFWAGRKPQSTNTIIGAFNRGGLKGKSYQTVYGVLNRRKEQVGDIVNVNGDWALAEWYGGQKPLKQRPLTKRVSLNPATFVDDDTDSSQVPDVETEPEATAEQLPEIPQRAVRAT